MGGKKRRRLSLQKSLFLLPNIITLASVFCGFYAMIITGTATTSAEFHRASLLLALAAVCDTLDGRVARMTKTQSAFGLQLDSLADVVSFGAAPALLIYRWKLQELGMVGMVASFAFLACGAMRLARFNVLSTGDSGAPSKPSKYMLGLPIPPAASGLVGMVIASHATELRFSPAVVLASTSLLALLMVSSVPFRSFKGKKQGAVVLTGLVALIGSGAALAVIYHPSVGLLWMLSVYICMGIFEGMLNIVRRGRVRSQRPSLPPHDVN